MIVIVVVNAEPKGVLKFGKIVAAGKANIVAPRMLETRIVRAHVLMNLWIHDAIKSGDLQKRPCFIAEEHNLTQFSFQGVKRLLAEDIQASAEEAKQDEGFKTQNQNKCTNLVISYEMDLTPTMSNKKKTGTFGPILWPYPLDPYACSG